MEEDAVHEIHDGFDVEEEGMGVVHELEHEDDLVLEEGHDEDHIDAASPDGKKKPKRKRRSAYAYFCAVCTFLLIWLSSNETPMDGKRIFLWSWKKCRSRFYLNLHIPLVVLNRCTGLFHISILLVVIG